MSPVHRVNAVVRVAETRVVLGREANVGESKLPEELKRPVRRHGILDDKLIVVERLRLQRSHCLPHEGHSVLREHHNRKARLVALPSLPDRRRTSLAVANLTIPCRMES